MDGDKVLRGGEEDGTGHGGGAEREGGGNVKVAESLGLSVYIIEQE